MRESDGRVIEGCNPLGFGGSRCRFEVALVDPVKAQVDAAVSAFAAREDVAWIISTPDVEPGDIVREMLAAAAAVVLERPPCMGCGRPLGTGTLLDYKPTVPQSGTLRNLYDVRVAREPITLELWKAFAVKYRCPACKEASP